MPAPTVRRPVARRMHFYMNPADIQAEVATALVGPVTFFGLLVASLAYQITGSSKHCYVLPVAVLLAIVTLVGGQVVLERVFAFDTALSIVIEFVGGIAFIVLVLRRAAR